MKYIFYFLATLASCNIYPNQHEVDLQDQETVKILETPNPTEWFSYAVQCTQKGDLRTAQHCYEKVLHRYPTSTGTLHNLAYTLRWQGKLDEAKNAYLAEIALDPTTNAYFGLAQTYLLAGNFTQGLPTFEQGRADITNSIPNKLVTLENIKGKTILILAEWGLGDLIQFVRYAQELKKLGATIMLQSHKALVPLLSRCNYIDYVIQPGQSLPYEPDNRIALLSLPHLFNTNLDTIPADIPYLCADHHLVKQWSEKITSTSHLNIGICWHGSTYRAYPDKNIPLSMFAQLHTIPGITWYSLQKIDGMQELTDLPVSMSLQHFGNDIDTTNGPFMDTAAIMKNLDLVITVDTSIAHLAGALGVPVWVLLPYVPDWRWMMNRTDSPWYHTMRLFRQERPGDWQRVLEQVGAALQEIQK